MAGLARLVAVKELAEEIIARFWMNGDDWYAVHLYLREEAIWLQLEELRVDGLDRLLRFQDTFGNRWQLRIRTNNQGGLMQAELINHQGSRFPANVGKTTQTLEIPKLGN